MHAVVNLRGTGNSEGFFQFNGPVDVQDTASVIEWLTEQPWSTGSVGMFGVSYFAKMAKAVAALGPGPLKATFAPYSCNDWYRGIWYHGGILNARFLWHWRHSPYKLKFQSFVREQQGEQAWRDGLDKIRDDEELCTTLGVQEALANTDYPPNQLFLELLMNPLDGPFWRERSGEEDPGTIPAFLGACWGNFGIHLEDWPPSDAVWTTFYLHDDGILSEHELWPGESVDTIDESPFEHGEVTYMTPRSFEPTDVLGPSVLTLYHECTGTEALVFVTLLHIGRDGHETELTRGWLRAIIRGNLMGTFFSGGDVSTFEFRK